jgi:Ca2+:H+ antiporter
MHFPDAVRRKAHHAASYTGNAGEINYNPFARTRSRGSQADIEHGMGERSVLGDRTASEANVPTIAEERRLRTAEKEREEFPAPHHAGTAPPISPTSARGFEASNNLTGEKSEDSTPITNGGTKKASADLSDETAVPHGSGAGVTKRSKFKNMFHKKNDAQPEEHNELGRVDSEAVSLEERKRRAHKRKIPVGHQIHAVLLSSWINLLLIFVPVGFAVYYSKKVGPVPVFIINFVAIIPLAAMLSYATEELAIRVGETLGGLLNATFGYVDIQA